MPGKVADSGNNSAPSAIKKGPFSDVKNTLSDSTPNTSRAPKQAQKNTNQSRCNAAITPTVEVDQDFDIGMTIKPADAVPGQTGQWLLNDEQIMRIVSMQETRYEGNEDDDMMPWHAIEDDAQNLSLIDGDPDESLPPLPDWDVPEIPPELMPDNCIDYFCNSLSNI